MEEEEQQGLQMEEETEQKGEPKPKAFYDRFFTLRTEFAETELPDKMDVSLNTSNGGQNASMRIENPSAKSVQKWPQFFKKVLSINAHSFQCVSAGISTMLINLENIHFSNLKDLSLYGNHIRSLESLYKLDLPKVKSIRLDENKIVSLKGFRKCSFPCLQQLDLEGNQFSVPYWLTEMHAPSLTVVRLQDWIHGYPRCDDKSWFIKLQTKKINYIRCPNSKRMKTKTVDRMLGQKYPKINIMKCNSNN